MAGIAAFDTYRDDKARELMIRFVQSSRFVDARQAVAALRELNHVGLAHVYRDACDAAGGRVHRVDYDPCALVR